VRRRGRPQELLALAGSAMRVPLGVLVSPWFVLVFVGSTRWLRALADQWPASVVHERAEVTRGRRT
jgi:hypothetical protein